MTCAYCRKEIPGPNMVEGGFCSALCRACSEHEEKLRANEHISMSISSLDDGGFTVEIKMRNETEFPEMQFREMTKNYDEYEDALRGLAQLCLSVADQMKEAESE